jgi:molecular chaperone DnaK (HSP70)
MSSDKDIIVGIDLGTTNSLVAVFDESGPRVVRDENGEGRLPSVLAFAPDGHVTIGWEAKAHAAESPTSTVFSIKRLMGRGYDELAASGELAHLPYPVLKRVTDSANRDIAGVLINGKLMTPPEISALILRDLRQRAEAHLGRPISKAVITVPAYFDDAQRQATRDAGRIAGLEVMRIVNEPTAAALAYGLGLRGQMERIAAASSRLTLAGQCPTAQDARESTGPDPRPMEGESLVAVYDLGGGTFDISILRLMDGVFEVQSTHGNTRLGGDDLDREIIALVQREIREQFNLEVNSPAIRQALRNFAESVKMRLSCDESATIEIDLGQARQYRRTLSRTEFEAMISPWVDRTIESCRRALADAKVRAGEVDQVILVGGSTRIPLVRHKVEELFVAPRRHSAFAGH